MGWPAHLPLVKGGGVSETVGIFTFFKATGVVRDTWHILSGSRGATCHVQN